MLIGVEIDFVVKDCLEALELYEKIFEIERVEVTNLSRGENEAVFNLYGVRFHMLDENEKFGLVAPDPEATQSMWFNVLVEDITETYEKAMEAGCKEIQDVTELSDYGVSNAIFSDPFSYVWMLHQTNQKVSFEERIEIWEKSKDN